jgi:glycosyltransferase involved in cell wall biosynthesis
MDHLMNRSNSGNCSEVGLHQTAVIIPARNQAQSIGLVLQELPHVACIIVVDNGSTDRTAMIAESAGCLVVSEPVAGYGRACLKGMETLRSLVEYQFPSIQYVAFIDGDFRAHGKELVGMLATLKERRADFVLGSRILGTREKGAMPLGAVLGNGLVCSLMKWIWGAEYTDLGPFRVIQYDKLMSLGMQDQNFGWSIEMQIKARLARMNTVEVPAASRRRVGAGEISESVSGTLRAGYKILFTVAKYAVQYRLRKPVPVLDPLAPAGARRSA